MYRAKVITLINGRHGLLHNENVAILHVLFKFSMLFKIQCMLTDCHLFGTIAKSMYNFQLYSYHKITSVERKNRDMKLL